MDRGSFQLGEHSVHPDLNVVQIDGKEVGVEPKAMEVLACLASQPGRVLDKESIIKAVWPDTFVTDDVLTHAISHLRKVLNDNAAQPRFIQTIPRRGYRLIAPVIRRTVGARSSSAHERSRNRLRWLALAVGLSLLAAATLLVLRREPASEPAGQNRLVSAPLTAYPGAEVYPSLSPDGSQVAFSWNGSAEDNFDIYVKLVGPGEPHRLTTDPGEETAPAWSPDGREIAFLRLERAGTAAIYRIPALGGAERRLTEVGRLPFGATKQLSWSPDGKWLALANPIGEPESGIWLFSIDGMERRRLTSTSRSLDLAPAFSPDGRALAFVRLEAMIGDVYILPLAPGYAPSGSPYRATAESSSVGGPCWAPDGRTLLYSVGGHMGYRRLMRITPGAAGHISDAIQLAVGEQATTVSMARGGRLVYARSQRDSNIWRLEIGSPPTAANPIRLIASTFVDHSPDYSPDGTKIAFASTRSGTEDIWISNADGSKPVQMTSMISPTNSNPRWSPDGRTIVFDSRPKGMRDLYLLDVPTGSIRRLTDDPAQELEARWSRDGKWIYFLSNKTGGKEVWKVPAAGGPLVPVTRQGGGAAFESPDGRWVYYSKGDRYPMSIWKAPVAGGEEMKVLDGLSYNYNFAATEKGIYFLALHGEAQFPLASLEFFDYRRRPASIEFFDFASGKTSALYTLEKPYWIGFALSPDHRWILYSQVDAQDSDLMVVEDLR